MDKETAENFIMTTLVENEKKKPQDKLSRKDIVEILTEDHGIPVATACLLYTSPSPRDGCRSRMPSSA